MLQNVRLSKNVCHKNHKMKIISKPNSQADWVKGGRGRKRGRRVLGHEGAWL